MATSPAGAVKSGRGRGKSAKIVAAKPDAAAKATRTARVPKAGAPSEPAPVAALDELEDLIKLEEENRDLRKKLEVSHPLKSSRLQR
ncbi:hypothetical protein [Rhizobium multihospitium]|uniref:hypothetical protein n=1 Tax=Rhizobium multihospitium TaxID=410764 RepID=UPI000B848AE6|nr:hypothetical protein [Rhizobium multihospitium]